MSDRTSCGDTFHWIGQSFSSCDLCGNPYWEHRFRHTYGEKMPWGEDHRVEITPEEAEAVKTKWGDTR